MKKEITLRQWIENFKMGMYVGKDVETQKNAGWYAWFCKDSSLARKTVVLGNKFLRIKDSPKINLDTMYIFFKNNSPMRGKLYDDFRICDIETMKVFYIVAPLLGYGEGQSSVWGHENDYKEALVQGDWKDVLNFFNK